MIIDVYKYTTIGGREENEDSVGYVTDDSSGLFVVADGLGGYDHGKQASECVVSALTSEWAKGETENRGQWLSKTIEKANEIILEKQNAAHSLMKSTVVALTIDGDSATWAHTGDSRLYYIHNNEIAGVTEDHSIAFLKYKNHEITRRELNTDPDQSVLFRALGNPSNWNPSVLEVPVRLHPGDAFLMCSDGMWEYIYDEEVVADLLKADTAQKWAEFLMLRAMDRVHPGHDNLTIMTIMLNGDEQEIKPPDTGAGKSINKNLRTKILLALLAVIAVAAAFLIGTVLKLSAKEEITAAQIISESEIESDLQDQSEEITIVNSEESDVEHEDLSGTALKEKLPPETDTNETDSPKNNMEDNPEVKTETKPTESGENDLKEITEATEGTATKQNESTADSIDSAGGDSLPVEEDTLILDL